MDINLALFIYIPVVAILLEILAMRSPRVRGKFALLTVVLNLGLVILLIPGSQKDMIVTEDMGGWGAPYGITFAADRFSIIMLLFASIVNLAVTIYAMSVKYRLAGQYGFYPLYLGVVLGVNGAFLTTDLFNLFVWFEVMLIASFSLMVFGGTKRQLEGTLKYLAMNLVSSFLFLGGVGLLYGKTGTLNLADMAVILADYPDAFFIKSSAVLFFISFAVKAALFPLFFWLPASYHTPYPAVSALFSGLLTKVGVYAIVRIYTLIFPESMQSWQGYFLTAGLVTMVIGAFAAAAQFEFRKILSFHIISQIGYVIMGFSFETSWGLAAAIFFLGHNMMAKTNLFLVSGVVEKISGNSMLKQLGSNLKRFPKLGFVYFISAFALAGLPPLSGFAGKLALIREGVRAGYVFAAVVSALVGIFTLFSMIKIWNEAFLKKQDEEYDKSLSDADRIEQVEWSGMLILVAMVIGLGIFADPVLEYCYKAAESLMNPESYINAII